MTIKSSKELVNNALKEIKTITSDEAAKLFKENNCNLIDIRDIRELEREGKLKTPYTFQEVCWNFGWIHQVHIINKEKLIHQRK